MPSATAIPYPASPYSVAGSPSGKLVIIVWRKRPKRTTRKLSSLLGLVFPGWDRPEMSARTVEVDGPDARSTADVDGVGNSSVSVRVSGCIAGLQEGRLTPRPRRAHSGVRAEHCSGSARRRPAPAGGPRRWDR